METRRRIRWLRIVLTAIGAYVISILVIALIVTIYAFMLAFSVRGAPDQTKITNFAQHFSGVGGIAIGVIVTFLAALWVARKVRNSALLHGFLVGAIVAVIGAAIAHKFSSRALIDFAGTLCAGALGGFIVARTTKGTGIDSSSKPVDSVPKPDSE